MIDRKEQLQKAIITNDMNLVVQFYEFVFSEKAPKTIIEKKDNSVEVMKDIRRVVDLLSGYIVEGAAPPKTATKKAIVKTSPKPKKQEVLASSSDMIFISSKEFELPEDGIPEYAEMMKKLSKRKKTTREPYRPKMIHCDSCNKEFDYNKEYPAGQLESGPNAKPKCNNCRSK